MIVVSGRVILADALCQPNNTHHRVHHLSPTTPHHQSSASLGGASQADLWPVTHGGEGQDTTLGTEQVGKLMLALVAGRDMQTRYTYVTSQWRHATSQWRAANGPTLCVWRHTWLCELHMKRKHYAESDYHRWPPFVCIIQVSQLASLCLLLGICYIRHQKTTA